MNSQLDQFAALFPNEDELQDRLVDLFGRIHELSAVRKLQGTIEHGKDIVFYDSTPFGRRRLNACVVKNTSITGSVSSQSGARTVLIQAQQAFDTPYVNGSGIEERAEHVYIISPRQSTPNAIESIKGALQQRAGQFTFLCGAELLDLFKSNWPQFLAFEGDFLGRYLNDLRLHLDTNPVVSALVLRHSIVAPAAQLLTEVYVPQRLVVQLNEFKPKSLSWYPTLFCSKVTSAEAEDAIFNLNALSGVLINSHLWLDGDEDRTSYSAAAATLRDIAIGLPRYWEDGYRQLYLKYDKQTPHRSMAEVALACPEGTLQHYAAAIDRARRCWDALKSVLAKHEKHLRSIPPSVEAIINDPMYPRHCALVEAASRSPVAIQKTTWAATAEITPQYFERLTSQILITAPAGFGKTSYCKYHALKDADNLLAGTSSVLPVYVALHQIAGAPINSFGDLLPNGDQLKELLASTNDTAVPFKRIRVYLDGLDEVSDTAQRQRIIREATSARLAWPVQVITTAREHVYDRFLTDLPRAHLSSFNKSEKSELIQKWMAGQPDLTQAFRLELARHKPLEDLMCIPLLATLIIGAFRKTSRLPGTKVGVYDMCVDLLCGGWDLVKNIQRPGRFAAHIKLAVLKVLAGQLHDRRLRHAEIDDVKLALSISMSALEDDSEAVIDEILQDGLLIRSGRVFLFSHFSFQEYLTAKNLADPTGKKQAAALRCYLLGDEWWQDVIGYYVGLLDNPHVAYEWVNTTVRGMYRSNKSSAQSELRRRFAAIEGEISKIYPLFKAPTVYANTGDDRRKPR